MLADRDEKAVSYVFHSTVTDFEYVYVSAGVRGLQIKINPHDLIGFTRGEVADIAVPM